MIGSIGSCPFNQGTTAEPVVKVTAGSIAPAEVAEKLKEDHGCSCG